MINMRNERFFKPVKSFREISESLNIRDCKLRTNVLGSVLADIPNDGNGRPLNFFTISKTSFRKGPMPKVEKLNSKNRKAIEEMLFKRNEAFKKLHRL